MKRPLLKSKVEELEALIVARPRDQALLKLISAELKHRSSRRAQQLMSRVDAALGSLSSGAPSRLTRQPSPQNDAASVTLNDLSSGASPEVYEDQETSSWVQSDDEAEGFTLIQPPGTQPRPTAFRPQLKEDVALAFSANDAGSKRFRIALDALLQEMRRNGTGQQRYAIEDGERVSLEIDSNCYQFEFSAEVNLFEGARVDLIIGARVAEGRLVAFMRGRIVVAVEEDFGETITRCILRIDNTALLQALHDRMLAIERGTATGFRVDLAERVLKDEGGLLQPQVALQWPSEDPRCPPTLEQCRFVEVAVSHDITWLWGPPGTGKTASLSALVRLLIDSNERVLICSNTNQAVDQLLLKLCGELKTSDPSILDQGRILRLGKTDNDLARDFGDRVDPDKVVDRLSVELRERQIELEAELDAIDLEAAYSQAVLDQFKQLDRARQIAEEASRDLDRATSELRAKEAATKSAHSRAFANESELASIRHAGTLGRLFKRSERVVLQEQILLRSRVDSARRDTEIAANAKAAKQVKLESCTANAQLAEDAIAGEERASHVHVISRCSARSQLLRSQLADIRTRLEALRDSILRDARVVGATVTRTFMRPAEFAAFDTVIIDEASMILLPALFAAVGLATKRVVVAGDFRQLPPIVQTEQKAIFDKLGHDAFRQAGLGKPEDFDGQPPRRVMLNEQFRMSTPLCEIVSETFYEGKLSSHESVVGREFSEPIPLTCPLTIVDTSRIWPFTSRNAFDSRLNVMHALAVRNLVLHLRDHGRLEDDKGKKRVGICSPYSAQPKLIADVLRSHGLTGNDVRVATVHSFQGDERDLLLIDLVDSVGERNAGIFLQANRLDDSGAKLLNVALSRAKEGVVIFANLTFLDRKLPHDALLRRVLFEIQRIGEVIDVHDILRLRPVADDLRAFSSSIDLDPDAIRSGLFRGPDFERLCKHDLSSAKQSIVILSGFITLDRIAQLADGLRERVAAGVRVRCVTRPPDRNGSMPEDVGLSALRALEGIGATIDLRSDIHEKAIIIDNKIVWFGSLNPLSHGHRTTELMARIDDTSVAAHLAGILSVRRRSLDERTAGAFVDAENPRCEICGGWSVFVRGRYGPFFRCFRNDGWKSSLDMAKASNGKR